MTNSKSLVVWRDISRALRQKKGLWLLVPLALAWFALVAGFSYFQGRQSTPVGVPVIHVAPMIVAEPWTETPLPIQLGPPEAVPPRGWLRIGGLPALSTLSAGYVIRPGVWVVPVSGLPTLKLRAPPENGRPVIVIALLAADGSVLAEARSLLAVLPKVRAPPATNGALQQPPADPAHTWIWPGARQEAQSLLRRGDEALTGGSIGAARSIYEYAAMQMHWPAAALALAATYDPNELPQLAPLVTADPELARFWYRQARELANARIDFYLQRLGEAVPRGQPLP
jgi:hypothetical protein